MTNETNPLNPLIAASAEPFGAPPLDRIHAEHFHPAFEAALAEHRAQVESISSRADEPTFENVVEALERSGELLKRVSRLFRLFCGVNSNPEIRQIERETAGPLAAHWSWVFTRAGLFKRIEALRSNPPRGLSEEQKRVLDLTHRRFLRAGAKLDDKARDRVAEIDRRLADLGAAFAQNLLKDEADYLLILRDEADLAGLPEETREAAARLAADRGESGAWAFSLSRSSVEPFLAFSARRDLRETIFRAWTSRGEGEGAGDNRSVATETLALRAERARLLGYQTFAQFKLDGTMAEEPEAVRALLEKVWRAGLEKAVGEREALQALARHEEGPAFELEAWDWRYWAEKLRARDFDFDEAELRSYLRLDLMVEAAFYVADRLFGLRFAPRPDLPVYDPELRAYEAKDSAGRHVALFYADYFARPTKRSGAWMSQLRSQSRLDADVRPIVFNVMNFAKGAEGSPSLGLDEARTLFHEFGHALHGMLSNVTYPSISGTNVPTDFVELPSQLFEHWLLRPEVLRRFARHHVTGEPIPDELMRKVIDAASFGQGFATVEYCASALVDLDLHAGAPPRDPTAAQEEVLARIGMPPQIVPRHGVPHFSHVFAGDHYAAGYYSYLWSEVLDADAFRAFEEAGDDFDPAVAARLRRFILEAGDSRPPREAYLAFRGRLPDEKALYEKRGLLGASHPAEPERL